MTVASHIQDAQDEGELSALLQAHTQHDTHLLHSYNHTAPSLRKPAYYHRNKRYLQTHDQIIPWVYPTATKRDLPAQSNPFTLVMLLIRLRRVRLLLVRHTLRMGLIAMLRHQMGLLGTILHFRIHLRDAAGRAAEGDLQSHPCPDQQPTNTQSKNRILQRRRFTHHPVPTNIPLDSEMLSQRRALQHHGHPVQEHGARQAEEPAVGVAGVDLLRVVGRVDVQALRGAAVQAGRAAPGAPLFCTRWLVR